ncbi:hypothetical protein EY643_06385 [Halioglobus maricola]|uniref:Uncharacterized protein n=1 Tax=Halioglobus maricola TaxID=2601894 RepID=A0A5P9NK09_9GAMM|nr:hypothetical protein [Halioglobus maricola]QFU75308.1 hypothetical protein EY643_06385 [Halioglobus maricola]
MTIFSRIFGRRGASENQLGYVEAQRKVLDYARYLEDSPVMPGRVVDESDLPHSKRELKASLLKCIGNSDDARLSEHLKSGYLMLSAFQSGVGVKALGTDFANLDLERDPMDIATEIEESQEIANFWKAWVQSELEQLQQDIYALELELAQPMQASA